jgi:hypothetical protein
MFDIFYFMSYRQFCITDTKFGELVFTLLQVICLVL